MPRILSMLALLVCAAALRPALAQPPAPGPKAAELRNLGIAALENERPAEAEATFRRLAPLTPRDPLAPANLAVALLRQQKTVAALAAADAALALAPGRADLLFVRADVLRWSGRSEEALAEYAAAARAAPSDVAIQQALLRQAQDLAAAGEGHLDGALIALQRLRPDNVAVMSQAAIRAATANRRETATAAFLRLREILDGVADAQPGLDAARLALERADLAAARLALVRLDNVLKPSPLYQAALLALGPPLLGIPVERFVGEAPPSSFGEPLETRFAATSLGSAPTTALAVADLLGDESPEIVAVRGGAVEVRSPAGAVLNRWPGTPAWLAVVDLDNDGRLDVLGFAPTVLWRSSGEGRLANDSARWFPPAGPMGQTAAAAMTAAAVSDLDLEGDLDLVSIGESAGTMSVRTDRNQLMPPTRAETWRLELDSLDGDLSPRTLVPADLDGDGDPDLLAAGGGGLVWFENRLAGRFGPGARIDGAATEGVAAADLDADGDLDLVQASASLRLWRNTGGAFEAMAGRGLDGAPRPTAVLAFDADNDGRLDLAAGGPFGVRVFGSLGDGSFASRPVTGLPAAVTSLAAADFDLDGDLDLAAAGPAGLWRVENVGAPRHHWMRVRLRGLALGSGKNNRFGLGATIEARAGSAYQFQVMTSDVMQLGLGTRRAVDSLRVVWTNGVPQHRLRPDTDQRIVEEQVLKGCCPFLYAWDGERVRFVTDLLWGAPIGLPVAPGVFAAADSDELVHVPQAAPRAGSYDLRITEELWEAAYFDRVRLWVVDHPEDVEVASGLRVAPGAIVPEEVRGSRGLRAPAAARDGRGDDVTDVVARRDHVYASGYIVGNYQGAAAEPWSLELDLGEAPARPIRLHLDGWIFPTDASLNLAMAPHADLRPVGPALEIQVESGLWRPLVASLGLPAGKTKTMVVDTPPLPARVRRLRIRSNLWLAWDRVAWTTAPADSEARVAAVLAPRSAALAARGFSTVVRRAPNAPHEADYDQVQRESPWLHFPGRYTRHGEVLPLLVERDSQLVVLAAGDELRLEFDASALPPPPPGWRRAVFLESSGWDKDADRNTAWAESSDPLPFQGMRAYPYAPGEAYPDDPALRRYAEEWLTRRVDREPPPP